MKGRKWIVFLLLGLFLLSGCGKSKESNLKVGNEIHSGIAKQEEEQEEKKEKEEQDDTMYVILQIDAGKQEVRLQNVETGKISEYGISDATAFRDKYGEFTGGSQITQGKIVTIGAENERGNLSYIQLSDKSWEQEDVEKFEIDGDREMITIGKTKYYYDDSLLVFLDDEQISLDMITGNDRLRIAGVDRKVASIFVTSGHGFLALTHTDLFEGGWLSVGSECVLQIEKNMKVEVPEGTYQVSAANDGYGDTKEVTVKRNETTVLNLEEYKGEGPKMGKVQFQLKPEGTTLKIDGKKVDASQPVELKYGTYQIVVSSEEYGDFKEKLVVSSPEAEITINMKKLAEEEKEKEEEEKAKSSSGSGSTSSSSGSSSSGSKNSSRSSSSSDSKTSSGSSGSKKTSDAGDSEESQLKKLSDFISTLLD